MTDVTARPAPAPGRDWVFPVRTNGTYQRALSTLKWRVFPDGFGPSVLAAGGVLLLAALFVLAARVEIAVKERSGGFCGGDADRTRAASSGSQGPPEFPTSSLCWPAGFEVKEGRRYRVTLDVTEPWFDDTIETSPAGTEPDRMGLAARFGGALLRRSPTARWFQPLAKIVSADGYHVHALEARPALGGDRVFAAEFQAERDGEVFLFVNDALLPSSAVSILGEEFQLYRNNRGKAVVTVDEVVRKASP